MNLLFFGDSITWGAWDESGGWVSRITDRVNRRFLNGDLDWCFVYNLGVSGDTSTDLLRRIESEADSRLPGDGERVFVIAIGTNDSVIDLPSGAFLTDEADFAENVESLILIAKTHSERVIFVGPPAVNERFTHPYTYDSNLESSNDDIARYNEIIALTCRANHIEFVPVLPAFLDGDLDKLLHSDGVHPSSAGHEVIANLVWPHIEPLLPTKS